MDSSYPSTRDAVQHRVGCHFKLLHQQENQKPATNMTLKKQDLCHIRMQGTCTDQTSIVSPFLSYSARETDKSTSAAIALPPSATIFAMNPVTCHDQLRKLAILQYTVTSSPKRIPASKRPSAAIPVRVAVDVFEN